MSFAQEAVGGPTPSSSMFHEIEVLGVELAVLVEKGLKALTIVALAWVAFRVVKLLTRRFEMRFDREDTLSEGQQAQRVQTLSQLLNSVARVAIVVAAGLTALNLFIPIGPLLAGVSVIGLAISFGAQSLVKDIISGFFILFENQFGIGDIVEVNGKGGVVERMTLRVVMLRDLEGILHVIPNGNITLVSNRTRSWSRVVIDVGVAYKERVDEVIAVLQDEARHFWEDPEWQRRLAEAPVVLGVQALGDSAVTIRITAQTRPGKQWDVKREFLRRIKNRLDGEGIEIPFPQRTLHLGDSEGLRKRLTLPSEP